MIAAAPSPDPSLDHWGVMPVLFRVGEIGVSSYSFFMLLGLATGLLILWMEARRNRSMSENSIWILLAALFGGAIGAKIPIAIAYGKEIFQRTGGWGALLVSGRSIVGGLAGGAICVFLVKRRLGITERKGNLFAPAIAAGMAVGRGGCFLRGCCYGTPTRLPWGVDFGDGVARHPAQIYESLFMLAFFIILTAVKRRVVHPAVLFWILMFSYFTFRFFEEFIRAEKVWALGLTFFQWMSLALAAVYGKYLIDVWREKAARKGCVA